MSREGIDCLSRGVVMLGVLCFAHTADAQTDQRVLAQQLLGPDVQQRKETLDTVRSMQVAQIPDGVRLALIQLLNRMNDVVSERTQTGQSLDQVEDPYFIAALSRDVARLGDPRAIPALSEAIYGGTVVTKALAAFGETAVPDVLRVVNSIDAHYNLVDHALIALRMIAERPEYARTSTATHEKIKAAAAQRLNRPGYFTTLWRAIDLAAVLRDPGLRQVLERLASSPNAVTATGITLDSTVIDLTQKRAADRLAGVPPTPRF